MTGRIGLVMLGAAMVGLLVPLWWWAINGLSEEIGLASGFTLFAVGSGGLLLWLWDAER